MENNLCTVVPIMPVGNATAANAMEYEGSSLRSNLYATNKLSMTYVNIVTKPTMDNSKLFAISNFAEKVFLIIALLKEMANSARREDLLTNRIRKLIIG